MTYYILKYNYSAMGGGCSGTIKHEVFVSETSLAEAVYSKQKSARCKDIVVIETERVMEYKPEVKVDITKKFEYET